MTVVLGSQLREQGEHSLRIPESVSAYVDASLAPNTRRAYCFALADFDRWCQQAGTSPLPATPETVATYLANLADAGRSVSTIQVRAAAIRWAHAAQGLASPTRSEGARATLRGIRRTRGVAPVRKAPATAERVAAMLGHADPATTKGLRDRALLLLGFATACRRSELVALDVGSIEETERGLLVTIRHSKTDQESRGHIKAVPFGRTPEHCPVRALRAWLEAAAVTDGPVLRSVSRHGRVGPQLSTRAVANIVKHYAKAAGLEPTDFSGHSLRAGFVTSAAERGKSTERIMDHTGHRSVAMVRVYTRRPDAFADHAGDGLL